MQRKSLGNKFMTLLQVQTFITLIYNFSCEASFDKISISI